MRRWLIRLLVLAALVAGFVALRATVFAPQPVEVTVAIVDRGTVEETVTNTRAGTVKARRRAMLSPEQSGLVVELPFAEGAAVRAGDVIVRLDATWQQARVELARRSLEAAEARHSEACVSAARAQRELDRNERVAEERLISENVLDQYQSAVEVAQAACKSAAALVEQARAELGVVEAELAKTVIRAPFEGVLAELAVEVGEFVTPSPPGVPLPAVIDLIDPSSIHVSAPMDEVDSARIHAGQPVRVALDPFPDRDFEGVVRRVAPYVLDVEEQNRTVEIEVDLADPELAARLLPGTSADVEVVLETREDVLRVPTATLMEGGRVLVLEGDRLVERALELGLRNWDWTEVTGGLEPGDKVVTSLGKTDVEAGARAVEEGAGAAR